MEQQRWEESKTTAQNYSELLAQKTTRRSFLGILSAGFAWLVGVKWVSDPLRAWDPYGYGTDPSSRSLNAPTMQSSVRGEPWRNPPDGPARNATYGRGGGCARE